jgi:ketosteroid isomerase-like protein
MSTPGELSKIDIITRYCEAGSRGDIATMLELLTDDAQSYGTEPADKPLLGAEHIARHWAKVHSLIGARWRVEHAVVSDDQAAAEWSMEWTSPDDGQPYVVHGAEFYHFRGDRIAEIRSYYHYGPAADTGLTGFPYAERGYTTIDRTGLTG